MMAYNQEAVVTSSQDGAAECTRNTTAMTDIKPEIKGRIYVNPRIAKVFPTVRKEEVSAELGLYKTKEKVKVVKKQVFPWLVKFNALCREAAGSRSYQRLDDLMNIYVRNVAEDVKNCYKKPNRASKLKTRMNDYLKLFHMLYKEVRKPLEFNHYLERMSDLLAMYLDMEIKASRRGKENPRTISDRLMSALFILLDNSMNHILKAIIKAKFFIKMFHEICIPIIQRVLRDIPDELSDEQYIQYVLVFKKWKVLVGRKEERQEINRLAAARLTPPPGFADLYHDSDKYTGLLPVVARGRKDKFTLMLMQAPGLSVKDTSEGYQHTSFNIESSVKSLDDLELNAPLLTDELIGIYDNDDLKSERCTTNNLKEMWTQLDELEVNGLEQQVMADLFEEEFTAKLRKRQEAEEKLRLEKAARKTPKNKKTSKLFENKAMSSHSCVHSTIPRSFGRVPAGPLSTSMKEFYCNTKNRRSVSKMEADSQSQDPEIIVIDDDDDEPTIKVEPEVKYEESEAVKREVTQPPVLRAVVRPENIEQLASIESNCDAEEKSVDVPEEVRESLAVEETRNEESETNDVSRVQEVEFVMDPAKDVTVVEADATSSTIATSFTEAGQAPSEEPRATTDLLLEEISKVSSVQDSVPQLWMDIDGNLQNQPFEDLFDPNDPNMFYPDGPGDTHNWSFSHDFILGQYDDDLFSQYECGNTNAFPDFYNDQQDMVFTGADIFSPPLLDMMRDEPGEYQLTTHWEDLSMMVSESYVEKSTSPEREEDTSTQTENEGPTVVFIDKRKGRRGKNKSKVKEPSPPSKEVEPVEKKSKEKPVEDVSKKSKKGQRRKRVHFEEEDDEEEEEEEEPEPEPQPQPKKRKGRQKKSVEPPPVQPASPPPQTSGRKRGPQPSSSAVTNKKAKGRKR
ncbi:uncharacterized protein LOC128993988 isoform X2 [Macrosteles quadrilineatus]|nr:uncharacterized protein LOC128993988 isoform X2 [Macrosteles quadrilineatus]XP_054274130.1 uncharacterized protein LOC128993988 isoform X2 [Macrosteles quadrilineatus]